MFCLSSVPLLLLLIDILIKQSNNRAADVGLIQSFDVSYYFFVLHLTCPVLLFPLVSCFIQNKVCVVLNVVVISIYSTTAFLPSLSILDCHGALCSQTQCSIT